MDKYLSKKEYLEKYDSNAGYALYVQNNIKKYEKKVKFECLV